MHVRVNVAWFCLVQSVFADNIKLVHWLGLKGTENSNPMVFQYTRLLSWTSLFCLQVLVLTPNWTWDSSGVRSGHMNPHKKKILQHMCPTRVWKTGFSFLEDFGCPSVWIFVSLLEGWADPFLACLSFSPSRKLDTCLNQFTSSFLQIGIFLCPFFFLKEVRFGEAGTWES